MKTHISSILVTILVLGNLCSGQDLNQIRRGVFQNVFNINYKDDHQDNSKLARDFQQNAAAYDDEKCQTQLDYVNNATANMDFWALGLYDSWGKIPSGIFTGNSYSLGNFDQCLKVYNESNSASIGIVSGQYCLVSVAIEQEIEAKRAGAGLMPAANPNALAINVGICIPETCSPDYFLNTTSLPTLQGMKLVLTPLPGLCYDNETQPFFAITIIGIVFFSTIVLLMLLSTGYDLINRELQKPQIPILLAFSMYTNGIKMFSCKKSKSPDVMHCLNGIRVLSIVWVIISHTYATYAVGFVMNLASVSDWVKSYHSMLFLSATVSVDSFFLLSGLLVTWSVLKELNKKRRLNVPLMYLHRYLRLTPPYAALMLFTISFSHYIGNGPIWNQLEGYLVNACEDRWWSSLLYVQNYVNPWQICLGHSWYLSVDMQLFVLSPLVLFPLWKWGRITAPSIVVLILMSMGCSFAIFYTNDFTLNLFGGGGLTNEKRMEKIYYATHTRMGAWLVGVLLGYILDLYRGAELRLSRVWQAVGWLISLGTIVAVIFGQYNIQQMGTKENLIVSGLYDSCSRVAWSIALGWIILACAKGFGGVINWFLSLSFWIPLARLSYSLYLIHFFLQMLRTGSARTNQYFTDILVAQKFWGDFGFTLTVSVFWCLAFESPIIVLEKYLIPQSKSSRLKADSTDKLVEAESENTKV